MIIEELYLKSFRGFKEFHLKCSPLTVLVGPNSSGKTTILQAVQLVFDILAHAYAGARDVRSFKWSSSPGSLIDRLKLVEHEDLWFHKAASEACEISLKLSGGIELRAGITRGNYELDLIEDGVSLRELLVAPKPGTIENILRIRPSYVPAVGAISPTEILTGHADFERGFAGGEAAAFWRRRLYWLYNDRGTKRFESIVAFIRRCLPGVEVMEPHLSHDSQPQVQILFEEGGTVFDIGSSGGGLRTLLNVSAFLNLSQSECLLFDEPDAHLHSSLQKGVARMFMDYVSEGKRQVFAATHAPDLISEIPIEDLVWIDKQETEGRTCNEVGKVLVDLGAISTTQAVQINKNKMLLAEGDLDLEVYAAFFDLAGFENNPFRDVAVSKANLPNGKGDAAILVTFHAMLKEAIDPEMRIACITDNDYDLDDAPSADPSDRSKPLCLSLRRKEIENYLIEPQVIAKAAAAAAREQEQHKKQEVNAPDPEQVDQELERILGDPEIFRFRSLAVTEYIKSLEPGQDQSTRLEKALHWFEENWGDKEWRRRNCPGKKVLKKLKDWCQTEYSLTLTDGKLIDALESCPEDIVGIASQVHQYFYDE